jgi:hypothetical protein
MKENVSDVTVSYKKIREFVAAQETQIDNLLY